MKKKEREKSEEDRKSSIWLRESLQQKLIFYPRRKPAIKKNEKERETKEETKKDTEREKSEKRQKKREKKVKKDRKTTYVRVRESRQQKLSHSTRSESPQQQNIIKKKR